MARGLRCKAHKHTSVVAEENHHLQPQSRGGRTVVANLRYLCANAHSDTHYLLDLIENIAVPLVGSTATPDDVYRHIPWPVIRTYGPGVRKAAIDGWRKYGTAFLAGEYLPHRLYWSTSGNLQPWARHNDVGPPPLSYPSAVATGAVSAMLKHGLDVVTRRTRGPA